MGQTFGLDSRVGQPSSSLPTARLFFMVQFVRYQFTANITAGPGSRRLGSTVKCCDNLIRCCFPA